MDLSVTRSLVTDTGPSTGAASSYLIVALGCATPLDRPLRICLDDLDEIELGRGATRTTRRHDDGRRRLRLDLADGWLSTRHCRVVRIGGLWAVEDLGSKNGTLLGGQARGGPLSDGDVITAGGTLLVYRQSAVGGLPDRDLARAAVDFVATASPELEARFAQLARLARAPLTILLAGPTGSGKEVVARAIHAASGRPGPFVAVNCGAIAPTLVESELFGVKRGAFSGATEDRPGLIRASDRGTLFLDEIGELPPPAQAALLRVLEQREVLPVGGHQPVAITLRVIAASHRDLAAMVQRGGFREDLYARLAGHAVALLPLGQRREDLGLLIAELLPGLAGDRAGRVAFSPGAAQLLFAHAWPLNVRELVQVLTAALALAAGDVIAAEHLPAGLRQPRLAAVVTEAAATPAAAPARSTGTWPAPVAVDRDDPVALRALFAEHGGNVSAVARALDTSRSQVRRLAARAGLELGRDRGDD